METWKPVVGKGYLRVMLRDHGRAKTVFVHHLVAEAFHGPRPSPAHEAAHLDGNRGNNVLANVAWVTRKENHSHKYLHGTMACGERQGSAKLTAAAVREIRAAAAYPGITRDLARRFNVTPGAITTIRRGIGWRHVT